MPEKNLITVVCTANICRSPMGEALLRHALQAEEGPLKTLKVISTGVSATSGDSASLNSIKALRNVGIDLKDHKSALLTQEIVDQSFCILCMTESHRMIAQMHFRMETPHLYLFRELIGPQADIEIPDPFGMTLPAYEACRDSMVEAVPHIINFLKENYK